ncbi:MAG: polyphosphate kinase 1 [Pseudomonadales bacterium]|nr:polyphosphate kinase 1 [Pseudomonadales bacterium]
MPRELSWLSFNERVLQEARSEEVPVIQRLRYLGIFSNNLDEFYRVRVAEVRRLISVTRAGERKRAENLLIDIQKRVVELQAEFTRTQATVLEEVSRRNIHLINEQQLDDKQGEFVRRYFRTTVLPELEPILLDKKTPMPTLNDESIYLAIDIAAGDDSYFALVEVPTAQLSRFIEIPRKKGKKGKVFIVLENVIRYCLAEVFRGVIDIESANAYTIKFSRDAELDIDTGFAESLLEKMETSLKQRRKAEAVRFVYDAAMPAHLLKFLADYFNLGKYHSLIGGGRYHNSKDFIDFPNVGPRYLEYKPLPQIPISRLETDEGSIFKKIRDKDILLYFPYHPFDYMTDLLKTAAVDPAVTDIKINLYRVASNSRICDALINAVYNGKKVLAVVELQARFDEAANINWAQRLADNGVEVLFGVPGLKVHSKLILIERRQGKEIHYYSHIGTGNFNEKTARLYTDFSLLTYDQAIGEDVANVFDFLKHNYRRPRYNDLLVSPHTTRSGLYKLINREISNARDGYPASMILKCNNLVDRELAMKLYEASDAGVSIKLIVRGMCSLLPGVKGLSENIEGVSIVDRYLEHPRVYMFYNRGEPRYLIGSADLMTRNLDRRVEVLAPVKDPDAQRTLQDILDQQLNDNIKARVLDAGQTNQVAGKKKHIKIRSQETIHEYLATGKLPRYPKTPATKKAIRRKKRA